MRVIARGTDLEHKRRWQGVRRENRSAEVRIGE